MTRSARAVHERLNSRNSHDNAEELFKTNEGTALRGEEPSGEEHHEKQRGIFFKWQRIFV
jgi:hypothetical protein